MNMKQTKNSGLPILTPEEEKKIIETFCGTSENFESSNGVQEYFERQVDKAPNAIALEFESKTLTYKELDQRANQVARYLRECGVSRDVFVGLHMERSLEMFMGILGALK